MTLWPFFGYAMILEPSQRKRDLGHILQSMETQFMLTSQSILYSSLALGYDPIPWLLNFDFNAPFLSQNEGLEDNKTLDTQDPKDYKVVEHEDK
ncbi:hypothetical protein BGAL_0055g00180 [Botrytis galanthina]|uniref:Uncharacterized protein n=1 Tax=Botrytis galanthina TaxID=278940 RepID=A0A4S8RFH6_9HELO|nr:hypothetical protein BGAL_0055g00180 [Botrytis galanthina]